MATPTTHRESAEPTVGAALLPIFAAALIVAVVVIGLVIAYPGTVLLVIAVATVIGFAAGIVALLARLIGPEGS